MNLLLAWLDAYSLPVVLLLLLGAAMLYVVKQVTEKAIEKEFDRRAKDMELQLQRRSNFAEKIVLDRYLLARDILDRSNRVLTALNRRSHGHVVDGLMRGNEIVPLTEVFELVENNRYLLPERLASLLERQAQVILSLANSGQPLAEAAAPVLALRAEINAAMIETFGLHDIS